MRTLQPSLALVFGLAVAAPDDHKIVWPGIEEPLASKHYSARVPLAASKYTFPWEGETPRMHAHYWYAESERDPGTDPIILWIQGGPGGSSIGGGFLEMGPLSFNSQSLATDAYKETGVPTPLRNPHSWTTFAGLLAVDYADVGFSQCAEKCKWDDAKATNSLVDFLETFFTELFPERAGRALWIAGESYAGILVSVTAAVIQHRPQTSVVLGGVLHGNGAIGHFAGGLSYDAWPVGFNTNDMPEDPRHHVDFFHRAGLVSDKLYAVVQASCSDDWWKPSKNCTQALFRMSAAMGDFTDFGTFWNVYNIYDTCSDMPHLSKSRQHRSRALYSRARDILPEHSPFWFCGGHEASKTYMNLAVVKSAMHIPASLNRTWSPNQDLEWDCSNDDETAFKLNFTNCKISDFRPLIKDVVSRVPFLVYSGDVDAQLPHTATERWTSELGFEEIEAWRPWSVKVAYVGGYVTVYEHNFTYATVKGAGHMVPMFRPEASHEMVRRFVQSQRLTKREAPRLGPLVI